MLTSCHYHRYHMIRVLLPRLDKKFEVFGEKKGREKSSGTEQERVSREMSARKGRINNSRLLLKILLPLQQYASNHGGPIEPLEIYLLDAANPDMMDERHQTV